MKIISVGQLTGYIKEKLESDLILRNVWVRGEVSNFKHHSSGHMYFTLKDTTSALRCVMFRSRNSYLGFKPAEGMGVIARGNVTLYERDGQYQLYVEEMQPDGVGALYTAFLQLKEKLAKEGLFDEQRKRPLPAYPRRVGVVTSPTGAAVRDIITVMMRRHPQTHIILIPVAVQGSEAPGQIAAGIRLANSLEQIDLLIVGRGGGSIEELWAFNTETVARSIYESNIPVISAVGHETDFTIADFVADKRAPTPSAAAEIAVPDCLELQKQVTALSQRLVNGVRGTVGALKKRVERAGDSQFLKRPKDNLHRMMQELDYLIKGLGQTMTVQLSGKKTTLTLQMSRLDDLSPIATMKRGFAVCRDSRGTVLKAAGTVKPEQNIEVILLDGAVDCVAKRVREGCIWPEKK